jgi:hypothetical protein
MVVVGIFAFMNSSFNVFASPFPLLPTFLGFSMLLSCFDPLGLPFILIHPYVLFLYAAIIDGLWFEEHNVPLIVTMQASKMLGDHIGFMGESPIYMVCF